MARRGRLQRAQAGLVRKPLLERLPLDEDGAFPDVGTTTRNRVDEGVQPWEGEVGLAPGVAVGDLAGSSRPRPWHRRRSEPVLRASRSRRSTRPSACSSRSRAAGSRPRVVLQYLLQSPPSWIAPDPNPFLEFTRDQLGPFELGIGTLEGVPGARMYPDGIKGVIGGLQAHHFFVCCSQELSPRLHQRPAVPQGVSAPGGGLTLLPIVWASAISPISCGNACAPMPNLGRKSGSRARSRRPASCAGAASP